MRIGFLGLGRMGLPMAKHMQAAGHDVGGYDTDASARDRATAAGIATVDSPKELADRDLIASSLPNTPHVEAAYAATGAIFDLVEPGTVCVDLSTISVAASREIAAAGRQRGVFFLDAPVSGTSIHAEQGTLVVMVGGDAEALERARPAIEPFAARVDHIGSNGAGLQLKLVTNRLLTTHLVAIAEAIVDMEAVGLDVAHGLALIRDGAVPKLLDYKAKPLMDRDYAPQFTIDLMRKDLGLAAGELPSQPLGALSQNVVDQVSDEGYGDEDLAAVMRLVEQRTDS